MQREDSQRCPPDSAKCLPERGMIVGSVLYAMVVSALVSVACSNPRGVRNIVNWIYGLVSWHQLSLASTHEKAFAGVGVLVFLTQYFCDEWKYSRQTQYVRENVSVVCWSWLLFLGQVCILPISLRCSSLLGLLAMLIISWGLFRCNDCDKRLKFRFLLENALWMLVLLDDAVWGWLSVWFCLLPLIFVMFRFLVRPSPPDDRN